MCIYNIYIYIYIYAYIHIYIYMYTHIYIHMHTVRRPSGTSRRRWGAWGHVCSRLGWEPHPMCCFQIESWIGIRELAVVRITRIWSFRTRTRKIAAQEGRRGKAGGPLHRLPCLPCLDTASPLLTTPNIALTHKKTQLPKFLPKFVPDVLTLDFEQFLLTVWPQGPTDNNFRCFSARGTEKAWNTRCRRILASDLLIYPLFNRIMFLPSHFAALSPMHTADWRLGRPQLSSAEP